MGLVSDLSVLMIEATHPKADNMMLTSMVMLWFSGICSAIVDNIPFVATMAPLVQDMASNVFHDGVMAAGALPTDTLQHDTLMPVWWALALGSCLGGNGSPIGASANVMIIGIAAKSGCNISFKRFFLYGIPVTLMTLAVSTVYIYLRYYFF